jgi:hypothetical protein
VGNGQLSSTPDHQTTAEESKCYVKRMSAKPVVGLPWAADSCPWGCRKEGVCVSRCGAWQVIVSGFAAGGLSEVPPGAHYDAASCAALLVNEIGIFGHKPELIADVLAGKRCQVCWK